MPRLEAAANVVLRVPALALLDLLYRWDAAAVAELLRPRHGDGISGDALLRSRALRGASCVGEGERGRRAWREWGRPGVWGGTGAKGRNALRGWERPGCARAVPAMGAPGLTWGQRRADMGTARALTWGHPKAWLWWGCFEACSSWGRTKARLPWGQCGDSPRP